MHGEFADEESFREHLRTQHPDIPAEAIPDAAFIARVEKIEAKIKTRKAGTVSDPPENVQFPPPPPTQVKPDSASPTPTIVEEKKPEPQPETDPTPLSLEYRWVGQCPVCRSETKTLILGAGDAPKTAYYAIAWCLSCDKAVAQKKVSLLK